MWRSTNTELDFFNPKQRQESRSELKGGMVELNAGQYRKKTCKRLKDTWAWSRGSSNIKIDPELGSIFNKSMCLSDWLSWSPDLYVFKDLWGDLKRNNQIIPHPIWLSLKKHKSFSFIINLWFVLRLWLMHKRYQKHLPLEVKEHLAYL